MWTRLRRRLGPVAGRALVWGTFLVTAPLYPVAHAAAVGLHGRGPEALEAAVSGLASKVRAPTPWRPSKLRLLVLTAYSPFGTVSPFMPRHIEQPDSRHSAPAAAKIGRAHV